MRFYHAVSFKALKQQRRGAGLGGGGALPGRVPGPAEPESRGTPHAGLDGASAATCNALPTKPPANGELAEGSILC